MKTKHFIQKIEKEHLVAAIQKAQEGNLGDIVLWITQKKVIDPISAAHEVFHRLSLQKTTHEYAVLIFLAPESRRLAVVGGTGISEKLPAAWWEELAATITASFAREQLTEGLLLGIRRVGEALLEHFPTSKKVNRAGQSDLIED